VILGVPESGEIIKAGPHGFTHGWVFHGAPGTQDHADALHSLADGIKNQKLSRASDSVPAPVTEAANAVVAGDFRHAKSKLEEARDLLKEEIRRQQDYISYQHELGNKKTIPHETKQGWEKAQEALDDHISKLGSLAHTQDLEDQLSLPPLLSDQEIRDSMGVNDSRLVSEMSDAELEEELARRHRLAAAKKVDKRFNPLELRDRRGRWYKDSEPFTGPPSYHGNSGAASIDPRSMPTHHLLRSANNAYIPHDIRVRFMDEWVRRHQEGDLNDEGRTSKIDGEHYTLSSDSKLDSGEWDVNDKELGSARHADALLNMSRDVMTHDGSYFDHDTANEIAVASDEVRKGNLTEAKARLQEAYSAWRNAALRTSYDKKKYRNFETVKTGLERQIARMDQAKRVHSDAAHIRELEQGLGVPTTPSDAEVEAGMGLNRSKTLEELNDAELEAELARRRSTRVAAVGKDSEPDLEKAGPHGYVHGWIYVGVGKDEAAEDKAEKVTDNVLAHRGGSASSVAGHKEAARLHRQAANASSSDEAIAYHKQMAQLHRAVAHGNLTNAQAKSKARRIRTGSKAKPVGHAADKLNMISTMKERRSLARSLSDKELEKTDEEFQRRAKALGKDGQVSRSHQAIRDEIEGRRGSKRGSSIRDSLPDEDFAGPHRSYPIITPKDLGRAASLAHHAADPESIRQRLREIAQRKFPGVELPPSLKSAGITMSHDSFFGSYDDAKQDIFTRRIQGELEKAGPHGYTHGWVHVGNAGTVEHDRSLNELGGLAANHSTEAANAIDRARTAAQEGRFSTAKDHMDNAAFLLHAAGRHSLARAAEGARDSFTGSKPPVREAPHPHSSARVTGSPQSPDSAREFAAVVNMPPGLAPVGSGHVMAVPGQSRTGRKSIDDEYELAKQQIRANRIATMMAMNASRYTSTVGDRQA
jgi:hypothetical protein